MSSLQEHIARHERAEGDAAPNESWWDLRRRLSGVEEENRVLYRRSEIYRKAWHEAQAETAARDAVIAKVTAYAADRAFHSRGHLNTVNSGRIASDLNAILGLALDEGGGA